MFKKLLGGHIGLYASSGPLGRLWRAMGIPLMTICIYFGHKVRVQKCKFNLKSSLIHTAERTYNILVVFFSLLDVLGSKARKVFKKLPGSHGLLLDPSGARGEPQGPRS